MRPRAKRAARPWHVLASRAAARPGPRPQARPPPVRPRSAVVSVITGGAGVLAYLVAWVIIPGEGQKGSIAENITGKNKDAWSG